MLSTVLLTLIKCVTKGTVPIQNLITHICEINFNKISAHFISPYKKFFPTNILKVFYLENRPHSKPYEQSKFQCCIKIVYDTKQVFGKSIPEQLKIFVRQTFFKRVSWGNHAQTRSYLINSMVFLGFSISII